MTERPYTAELDAYENEVYGDLSQYLDIFDDSRDMLFSAIETALLQDTHNRKIQAIGHVLETFGNHMEAIEELTAEIFDTMDIDDAARAWAQAILKDYEKREVIVTQIDPSIPSPNVNFEYLEWNGAAHGRGRQKEKVDRQTGVLVGELPPVIDPDAEGVDECDDYGHWVIAVYAIDLRKQVYSLLDLISHSEDNP